MIVHDTLPGLSYQTYRNLPRLREAAVDQWGELLRDVNEVAIGVPFTLRFYFHDDAGVTQVQAQAFVDAHDNGILTSAEQSEAQRQTAESRLRTMWSPVQSLGVDDAVIIVWARRLAQIRANVVVIDTKAQAASYWNAEWLAAASADRTAGNDNQKGLLTRDSFQAVLELVSVALVR